MAVAEKLALYFGYGRNGHFLRWPESAGRHHDSLDPTKDVPGFPWSIKLLDTGLLQNRKVVDQPDGRVHWTCGGKDCFWFAFFWWDRSGDTRPNSNSGFYVRWAEAVSTDDVLVAACDAFAYACAQWPKVLERQKHPLVLIMKEGP